MKINDLNTLTRTLPYFTKHNIGLALNANGSNLDYWIKKLIEEKLLIPLKSGFYISPEYETTHIVDPAQRELYWVYIANALYAPSYVSLEYVLSRNGIIPESVFAVTSITQKRTRTFESSVGRFVYRTIKEDYYNGYEQGVFKNGLTIRIANSPKALFDFLYLRHFSSKAEIKQYMYYDGRINWDALTQEQIKQCITYCATSNSRKMAYIGSLIQDKPPL